MSYDALLAPVALAGDAGVQGTRRTSRYFLGMSIFLLAVVFTGFFRTLFLRSLFPVLAIPWYVYVHGSVMAAWFVLLVVQTSLVAAHRTDLHRRFGIGGAVIAVAVVVLGVVAAIRFPAHLKASGGVTFAGPLLQPQAAIQIMWGDLGAMTLFPILVGAALWMRRRPDAHKRLLLLASMALAAPAFGRIQGFPALWGIASSAPLITIVLLILPIAVDLFLPLTLVGHDLLTARRLHRATLWGIIASVTVGVGFNLVLPATAAGCALWSALQ